jgi:ABC-type sugar transport system ATPase subunit
MSAPSRCGATPREDALLDIRVLSKTFPGGRALDDVSLSVRSGEIVAVIGQNGSGKSTLVKVLAGVYRPDAGAEMRYRGEALESHRASGDLHFIHQDLGLIPMLTTVENLSLAVSAARSQWAPNPRDETRRAKELIARFDADFDVEIPIAALAAAERTIVAIARALDGWTRDDNVLVLDEPTAMLHGEEAETLLRVVRQVAARGAGVLFISHRLDEVRDLADRIVVLRNGRVAGVLDAGGFADDDLVRLMTGSAVAGIVGAEQGGSDDVVLRASSVRSGVVHDVSVCVRAGEIVGVTGIMGSGREHLGGLIFGAIPREAGTVTVNGVTLPSGDPRAAIFNRVGYVPADRHAQGAVMSLTARENLTLSHLGPLRRRMGRLDGRSERAEVRRWMSAVGVQPPEPERELALFSGGNQQKIVLAKWLRAEPAALILDEPTQGVDVGAKSTIYELVRKAAQSGTAVLLSSSETKDLTALCDRVLVMRDGHVVAELDRDAVTEARLLQESVAMRGEGSCV